MPTALTVSGKLTPGEPDGSTSKDIDVTAASTFTVKSEHRLALTGSATKVVDLGSIATCKALLVKYETDGNPITTLGVRLNGAVANSFSLQAGGWALLALTDINALSIVHTAAATVRIVALG